MIDTKQENSNNPEAYQLTIIPDDFYEVPGMKPTCVICEDEHHLEKLDRFEDTKDTSGVSAGFFYEGEFMMCPECGHAHYIADAVNYIKGPVTIQWSK